MNIGLCICACVSTIRWKRAINWMLVMWIIRAQMASDEWIKKNVSLFHATLQSIKCSRFFSVLLSITLQPPSYRARETRKWKMRWRRKTATRRTNNDTPFVLNSLCRACVDLRHRDGRQGERRFSRILQQSTRQYASIWFVLFGWCGWILTSILHVRTNRFRLSSEKRCKTFHRGEQIASVDKTTKYKETNLFDQWQIDFGLSLFCVEIGCSLQKSEPIFLYVTIFPGEREKAGSAETVRACVRAHDT